MKVGLVRHFKVDKEKIDNIDYLEYSKWLKEYDRSPIISKNVDLKGLNFDRCYSSDIDRAFNTAKAIYNKDIFVRKEIREVDLSPIEIIEGQRSVQDWFYYAYKEWKESSRKVKDTKELSRLRVNSFLDEIEIDRTRDENILIVSHSMIMTVISEELKKRGFKGPLLERPENGNLYILDK